LVEVHTHPGAGTGVGFSLFDREQLPRFARYVRLKLNDLVEASNISRLAGATRWNPCGGEQHLASGRSDPLGSVTAPAQDGCHSAHDSKAIGQGRGRPSGVFANTDSLSPLSGTLT
jgi:hypothetical protein